MSVELPEGYIATPASNDDVIQDVIVVIGGYGAEDFSQTTKPLPASPAYSGTGDLFKRVQSSEISVPVFHQKMAIGLKGTLIDSDVQSAFDFINDYFHPLGKLIIYGHSMGGAAALRLCRKIDKEGPYYSYYSGLTMNRISVVRNPKAWASAIPGPAVAGSNPLNLPVRVDLLLTVDAANGPGSSRLDRTVAKCVRTNLNYYQTTPYGTEGSFGGPNSAVDGHRTIVWNHDLTGRVIPDADTAQPPHAPTHITIDEQTNNVVIEAIKKALKEDQVTDFMDVAAAAAGSGK